MSDSESESDSAVSSYQSDEEEEEKSSEPPVKKAKVNSNDADEGKTIFIRNLPYTIRDDDLSEWAGTFGDTVYSKVVMDKKTSYSKGMGFIKYKEKSHADTVLLKSLKQENDEEFTIDGRRLSLCLAVTREKVTEISDKNKKQDKNSTRNLHLARIGMIRPGSKEAEGLTKLELAKRDHLMKTKRKKLNDPNVFISPLRLCVCNLPLNLTDKELLLAFKKAGGPGAHIDECRIMRDMSKVQADGKAKSKGYGFVAFDDHKHALAALMATNNSVDIFGEKNRLIVEFSLENSIALETKKRRELKSKAAKTIIPTTLSEKEKGSNASSSQINKTTPVIGGSLPKHFGAKNRRRDRHLNANKAKKPKGKMSRSQRRSLKKKPN